MASLSAVFVAFARNDRWDVAEQLCRTMIDVVRDDPQILTEAYGGLELCLWRAGRAKEALKLHVENREKGRARGLIAVQFAFFAADYEERNVGTMGYRGHTLVAETLMQHRGRGADPLRVLDLGCGTGLLGRALRPIASTLTGVDLTPEMAAKASAAGVYDKIVVADAIDFLQQDTETWDAIVASSVFQFIPDLKTVFSLAASRLAEGGLIVATIDRSEKMSGAPIVSVGWGVFAFNKGYVLSCAEKAGLDVVSYEEHSERRNGPGGSEVDNAVICLRRRPTGPTNT